MWESNRLLRSFQPDTLAIVLQFPCVAVWMQLIPKLFFITRWLYHVPLAEWTTNNVIVLSWTLHRYRLCFHCYSVVQNEKVGQIYVAMVMATFPLCKSEFPSLQIWHVAFYLFDAVQTFSISFAFPHVIVETSHFGTLSREGPLLLSGSNLEALC